MNERLQRLQKEFKSAKNVFCGTIFLISQKTSKIIFLLLVLNILKDLGSILKIHTYKKF